MPPSSSGKADGVQILEGSDIPSQYVDATKHYLTGRRIDSLVTVGALTGTPQSVALRADGIIANLPANGRIEAAELVRMESPSIFATLFPEEQQALPTLWPLLVAPEPNAMQVDVPTNQLEVTEQRTPPSGLVPPASIPIASLKAEWQMVARRVQLVFNADADATTIQLGDIDQVLVMPEAFTPAEVEQLKEIRKEFTIRATSPDDATAIVPEPGHKATSANVGALTFEFQSDLVIHERRTLSTYSWSARLTLDQHLEGSLKASANDAVIILALDSGTEHVLSGANNPLPSLGAGEFVVERYTGGQRQETNEIALPPFVPGDTATDITQYLDYNLVLANQTALVKNVAATSTSNGYTADFHYDLTAMPDLGDPNVVARVASPPVTLPTGHYEVTISGLGTHALDIYPNGVMFSDGHRLLPNMNGGNPARKTFDHRQHPYMWQFTPDTNHFHYWMPQRESGVTVTPLMRTK